jgi:hypothetical protein
MTMEHDPEERAEEMSRLASVARQAGLPIERMAALLRALEQAETDTRRVLARDVYGVPDELLDDVLRLRLRELEVEEG